MDTSYEDRMIEAYIQKPEATEWYRSAFDTFNVHGVETMKWKWSWWAFFGSYLFSLYRKQYITALIIVILQIAFAVLPGIGLLFLLIFTILVGGYSAYIIYKDYRKKLAKIENTIPAEDVEKRVEAMRALGGYNQWVIYLYVFLLVVSVLFVAIPLISR